MNTGTATTAHLDQLIAALRDSERSWGRESLASRRNLLLQVHANVAAHAEEWVHVAGQIKQVPVGSSMLGEEWTSGPWPVLAYAEALADSLTRAAEGRDLLAGYAVGTAPGGRVTVDVLPHNTFERLLLSGFRAQVWMEPGVTEHETATRLVWACARLADRGRRGGDGRRQHHLDRAAGRALPAIRPQPGCCCSSSTRSLTRCWPSSRCVAPLIDRGFCAS